MQELSLTALFSILEVGTKVRLIDVRSPEEFGTKHLKEADNVPLDNLGNESIHWSHSIPIGTVWGKGGGRSKQAASLLSDMGFQSYILEGGTTKWFNSDCE